MISLFLFLISSCGAVLTANMIKNDPTKIIDIVHYNFAEIEIKYLSDFLVLCQTVLSVSLLESKLLSEFFLVMSIVQFLKSICSISTVLPPLKNYSDKYRLGGINGTGTEYIFSGHASYSALSAIYLYNQNFFSFPTLLIYNTISQFTIVITRNHYTIDIVLAWIITFLVWSNLNFCKEIKNCYSTIEYLY